MPSQQKLDEYEVEALLQRLAQRLGLQRDRSKDLPTLATGSSPSRRLRRPEVSLRFKGRARAAPTLQGRLIEDLRGEYMIEDKSGRAWRATKSKWVILTKDDSGNLQAMQVAGNFDAQQRERMSKSADPFTREKRSEIMSRIRSTGTQIELMMKKALKDAGISFQYQPKLYGKPDFLVHPRIAVFCDSSFWHGRNWNKLKKKLPAEYWYGHIKKNRKRDAAVNRRLRREGFAVLRFWDTEIKSAIGDCINEIKVTVRSRHEDSAEGGLVVCR